MRKLSTPEASAVAFVNFLISMAALVVCGLLSNWLGDWLFAAWFVGSITLFAWCFYRNSLRTYVFIGVAVAAVVYFEFWHPIDPS